MTTRTVKVAIIGSGLAGLTAAYSLSPSIFDVHIFEKSSTLGMDSSSISIPVPGEDTDWRIDVPMRSFHGGYYHQLIALYKHLGVQFKETDFSYSFSSLPRTKSRSIPASLIYNGRLGVAGVSMTSAMHTNTHFILRPFAKLWTFIIFALATFRLLLCYLWLLVLSIPIFRFSNTPNLVYSTWVKRTIPTGFIARALGLDLAWINFTDEVLIPLFSALCGCPVDDVQCHPVEEYLDYVWMSLDLATHHYVAKNGVREVVSKLSSQIQHIHLSSPISSLQADPSNPSLASIHTGEKIYSGFHHVIIATQANRAVPILESYASSLSSDTPKNHTRLVQRQIECLRKFKYTTCLVVTHTDTSLVCDDHRDRRDLNLVSHKPTLPTDRTMATHYLSPPFKFPKHLPPVYQTTNPIVEPREGRILSTSRLERAVVSMESKKVLGEIHLEHGSRLGPVQGAGRLQDSATPGIWLVGSYAYSGIPLLEGCVVSARNVVEQGIWESEMLKLRVPW